MKKYILLLALCSASFACKKSDAPTAPGADVAVEGASAEVAGGEAGDNAADTAGEPKEPVAADTAETGDAEAREGDFAITSATTLTSAGAKPHRVLSFELSEMKPGSAVHTADITTTAMGQTMTLPRIVSTFTTRDLSVKDGQLSVTFDVSDQRFEKRADDEMHRMLVESMQQEGASGAMTASFVIDKFGQTSNVQVLSASDDDAQEALSTALGNISAIAGVFPEEAIGVGATWTTTTHADLGGALRMEVTAYNTLEGLTNKEAVIVVRYEAADFLKALGADGLADMGGAKVTGGELKGGTRSVVRFDSLLATVEQNMTVSMEIEIEGQKAKAEVVMNMTIKPTN